MGQDESESDDNRKSVDREAPTPRTSGSFSAFLEASREIAERLEPHRSPIAVAMREKALELAATFESWPTSPPDTATRSSDIQTLIDLSIQVRAFVAEEEAVRVAAAAQPAPSAKANTLGGYRLTLPPGNTRKKR